MAVGHSLVESDRVLPNPAKFTTAVYKQQQVLEKVM